MVAADDLAAEAFRGERVRAERRRGARAGTPPAARSAGRRRSPRSRAVATRIGGSPPRRPSSGVAWSWRPQISVVGVVRPVEIGGSARTPSRCRSPSARRRRWRPGTAPSARPCACGARRGRTHSGATVRRVSPRVGSARNAWSARPKPGAGSKSVRPSVSTSTSAVSASGCATGQARGDRAAERVADDARAAPCTCARSVHAATRRHRRRRCSPTPRGPAGRGRRPGAWSTSSGITRSQWLELPAGPWSRTTVGPSPPSSTAVNTPSPLRRGVP